jgi:hypothetical protein
VVDRGKTLNPAAGLRGLATTESRAALLKSASQDWTTAQGKAKQAGKLEIEALNLLRSCGMKLQEANFGKAFANSDFLRINAAHLPADLTLNAARFCVHLCRSFPSKIESLEEARSARRVLFECFQQETPPKRLHEQAAHEDNPWNVFVSEASSFTNLFRKLETDSMTDWSKDKLALFSRETKPIAELHAKAAGLLR